MWKGIVQRFLRAHGYILVREADLTSFLTSHDVDLVIDVGANVGQYAQHLRRHGYRQRILSYEPIQSVFEVASAASRDDALWTVIRSAVGAEVGEAAINVSELSVFSSFKKLRPASDGMDTRSAAVRTESVPVTTIDRILDIELSHNVFVKVDTQGFEREVLRGAKSSLPKIVGLQLELPVVHVYEDVWSLAQALEVCAQLGYVPAQVRAGQRDPAERTAVKEFDFIFRRYTS